MISIARRRLLRLGRLAGAAALAGGKAAQAVAALALPTTLTAATIPAKSDRVYRIFMVLGRGEGANETGFKDYLARRGMNVQYVVRNMGGDTSKLPGLIEEIRAMRPDLIYTWGTPQTRGLVGTYDDPQPSRFIRDIPVVFTFVADPLDAMIVRSLEKPGGSVTGTIHIAPLAAQVNTILSYRAIRRLGVVYNPAERNSVLAVRDLRAEWRKRGLELIEVPAPLSNGKPNAADIPGLIERCKAQGAEMLYLGPDTFMAGINRKLVSDTALALKLPTFSVTELIVRSERAMFALSSSSYGIGRFTGVKAAQILLEGKAPGEIPIETLRRFSVVINMATVKELSFYPPIGLLNFAEVVGL
jgi:putative ABC transport system substrate-binding protein